MKTWTVTCFGREVLKVEMREEASIADVVRHMVAQRLGVEDDEIEVELVEDDGYGDLSEGLIPCECCGEMFDPAEVDDEVDEVNARFADLTERLIWGPSMSEEEPDEKN